VLARRSAEPPLERAAEERQVAEPPAQRDLAVLLGVERIGEIVATAREPVLADMGRRRSSPPPGMCAGDGWPETLADHAI
jgi:hypothetical protein